MKVEEVLKIFSDLHEGARDGDKSKIQRFLDTDPTKRVIVGTGGFKKLTSKPFPYQYLTYVSY